MLPRGLQPRGLSLDLRRLTCFKAHPQNRRFLLSQRRLQRVDGGIPMMVGKAPVE